MVEQNPPTSWWPSLNEPFRSMGARLADWFAPASEASANGESYVVRIELPGVEAEDVDVSVHDGTLTIKGEKRSSREEKGENYFFSERQFGSFSRSFRLPSDADEAAVAADMKDGVLVITVPKHKQTEPARKSVAIRKG